MIITVLVAVISVFIFINAKSKIDYHFEASTIVNKFPDDKKLGILDVSSDIGYDTGLDTDPKLIWEEKRIFERSDDIYINMYYPEFNGNGTTELNKYINGVITDKIEENKRFQVNNKNEPDYNGWYFIDISSIYRLIGAHNGIASIEMTTTDYSGGGNGDHSQPTLINWDLKSNKLIIDDKIFCASDYRQKLLPIIRQHLISESKERDLSFDWLDSGLESYTQDNKNFFLLKNDGVIMVIPAYYITAGAYGIIRIFIPNSEIDDLLCKI